jgi:hypothetical protein
MEGRGRWGAAALYRAWGLLTEGGWGGQGRGRRGGRAGGVNRDGGHAGLMLCLAVLKSALVCV